MTAKTASANLVAMPTRAVHHIQNNAPGPPRKMAVATPAMLPVPMVAESDVIKASKGLISPSSEPFSRPFQSKENPKTSLLMGTKFKPACR